MPDLNAIFPPAEPLPSSGDPNHIGMYPATGGNGRVEWSDENAEAIRAEIDAAIATVSQTPDGTIGIRALSSGEPFTEVGTSSLSTFDTTLIVIPFEASGLDLVTGESYELQINAVTVEGQLAFAGFGELSFTILAIATEGGEGAHLPSKPPVQVGDLSDITETPPMPSAPVEVPLESLQLPASAPNNLTLPDAWTTSSLRPLFVEGLHPLFILGGGSHNPPDNPGRFIRSGEDSYQGLVTSFPVTELTLDDEFIRAEFFWRDGGSNNAGQQALFGFFDGPPVDQDAQRERTENWTGYFFALGTRTHADGDTPYGIYWQGPGELPLFNHVTQESFPVFTVDGISHRVVSGVRPPLRTDGSYRVVATLTRLSANQLEFTVTYRTTRSDGSQITSFSALGRSVEVFASAENGQGTIRSVWTLPADTPMRFSAIAIAATANFTLTGLNADAGSPSDPPFDLNHLPPSAMLPSVPAEPLPEATVLPTGAPQPMAPSAAISLPAGSDNPMAPADALHLPSQPSRSLLEIASGQGQAAN